MKDKSSAESDKDQPQEVPATDPNETTESSDKVAEANREAAKFRTERNAALRRASALETMLDAHNIDHSTVNDQSVKGLEIKNGKVVERFVYQAPKIRNDSAKPSADATEAGSSGGLTREGIEKMSEAEINKAWEDGTMQSFLKSNR